MSRQPGPGRQQLKVALGLLLGFGIGAFCRVLDIPSPAPPVLAGAVLVFAMTVGYIGVDRWLDRKPAALKSMCGGPDGSTKHSASRTDEAR